MLIERPRGTADILPEENEKIKHIEDLAYEMCRRYGYGRLSTPVFEHTELFERGVGGATDIVQKEMYTFEDRGGRSLTLRAEGTAPAVRAYLQNGLHVEPQPVKLYYFGVPIFRYEKPQAGRLRQHHQFGIEIFGAPEAAADAEVITFAHDLFSRLDLEGLSLKINSIGCPDCRGEYVEALKDYYRPHLDALCDDCRRRFDVSPLRLLDCKEDFDLRSRAPSLTEHLCEDCEEHFCDLRRYLDELGLDYQVEDTLVRGLDYYTKTVFEFVCQDLGAQEQVCGGGRYDNLVELLGGEPTPAVGFGLGLERLLLALEEAQVEIDADRSLDIFLAALGRRAREMAVTKVHQLRRAGFKADTDYLDRSLKAQMRYADRYPAQLVGILGEREIAEGVITLRDMCDGTQQQVPWEELSQRLPGWLSKSEE